MTNEIKAFHPLLVFRRLFYNICLRVDPFRSADPPTSAISSPQFTNAIEVAFCQYASEINNAQADEILVHQNVLLKFKELWTNLISNVTCFSCLARSPENTLECHHSLCTTCTMTYGQSAVSEPWTFFIEECPLCGKPNETRFSQKPDTAGVRALIAEGGGIRAVVPLSFLQELENAIGLPMNIQEHFDIAFGSSSGTCTPDYRLFSS